jgi:hypothetical protein
VTAIPNRISNNPKFDWRSLAGCIYPLSVSMLGAQFNAPYAPIPDRVNLKK